MSSENDNATVIENDKTRPPQFGGRKAQEEATGEVPATAHVPATDSTSVASTPESYAVTRDELLVVANHWIEFLQGLNLFWVCYRQCSRRDEMDRDHARMRLNELCGMLGVDVLRQMQEQSDEKLRERIGQERWRIYTAGTDAERLQFADDNHTQTDQFMRKFYNDSLADGAFARLHGDPALTYTDADGDVWFFGARDCTATGKLNLALRTADGSVGYDGGRSIDRPAGWTAPPVAVAAA